MNTTHDLAEVPGVIGELGISTDLDASVRFALAAQPSFRYSVGLGWFHWDGTHWAAGSENEAIELAKYTAREWTKILRKRRVKKPRLQESGANIRAVVKLAESSGSLIVDAAQWDRNAWLLNVANGTIDLKTGLLRPHRKEDFITKVAPVTYLPEATHPILERYLNFIRSKDEDMVPFLARCFGAALTGDASTESVFLLQGDGGSGKTTLVEAISAMLGTYARKLRFESFCSSKNGRAPGGASPDLVTLRGARLAYASEGDQSARLDAGLVKELSGKEPITARALYSDPVTFPQTWKLWLVSNYSPKVDGGDTGIWRRLLKLHFDVVPPAQRDPSLKEALTSDPNVRSALLAWCVAGCKDWQNRGGGREGLALCRSVQDATEEYQKSQDLIGQWWMQLLENEGQLLDEAETPKATIRDHYERWCRENGTMPVAAIRFAAFLEARGLIDHRSAKVRVWRGISFDSSAELSPGISIRPIVPLPRSSHGKFSKTAPPIASE